DAQRYGAPGYPQCRAVTHISMPKHIGGVRFPPAPWLLIRRSQRLAIQAMRQVQSSHGRSADRALCQFPLGYEGTQNQRCTHLGMITPYGEQKLALLLVEAERIAPSASPGAEPLESLLLEGVVPPLDC